MKIPIQEGEIHADPLIDKTAPASVLQK